MPDTVSYTRLPDLTFHLTVEDIFDFEHYSFAHVPAVMQRNRMMRLRMVVTAAICFLLSDRSGHTTGQWLHPDGGYVHLDRALPASP